MQKLLDMNLYLLRVVNLSNRAQVLAKLGQSEPGAYPDKEVFNWC